MANKRQIKKLTKNQQQAKKQIQRIKQAIKRLEKQGWIVDYKVPTLPTRVTKQAIKSLKGITPSSIRRRSKIIDAETGEILSGRQGQQYEKQRRKQEKKPKKSESEYIGRGDFREMPFDLYNETVIARYREYIGEFSDRISYALNRWLDNLIETRGIADVVIMLSESDEKFEDFLLVYRYDSDQAVQAYSEAMLMHLPALSETDKQNLRIALDENEQGYQGD